MVSSGHAVFVALTSELEDTVFVTAGVRDELKLPLALTEVDELTDAGRVAVTFSVAELLLVRVSAAELDGNAGMENVPVLVSVEVAAAEAESVVLPLDVNV